MIRLFASLIGFTLFLSITFKNKPIFYYIYDNISPLTTSIQETTKRFILKSFSRVQKLTKNMFKNSTPSFLKEEDIEGPWKHIKDSVRFKSSSLKSFRHFDDQSRSDDNSLGESMEEITFSEKEELSELIQKNDF